MKSCRDVGLVSRLQGIFDPLTPFRQRVAHKVQCRERWLGGNVDLLKVSRTPVFLCGLS
jgi:hypothetical protein